MVLAWQLYPENNCQNQKEILLSLGSEFFTYEGEAVVLAFFGAGDSVLICK